MAADAAHDLLVEKGVDLGGGKLLDHGRDANRSPPLRAEIACTLDPAEPDGDNGWHTGDVTIDRELADTNAALETSGVLRPHALGAEAGRG